MSKLARIREQLSKAISATISGDRDSSISQAHQLLEAEYSHSEIHGALYSALRANRNAPTGEYIYRWIHAVYDSHLIFEEEIGDSDKLYKASYSIADDGTATITNPVEVRIEYVPVAQEQLTIESASPLLGGIVQLTERAINEQNTALIKIIGTGWGSSGYYSESLLRDFGASALPIGTHMFWNHPTFTESIERPERDLTYLAAVITETPVYMAEGAKGPGLYAKCRIFEAYKDRVEDIAEHIGLSVNLIGTGAQGTAEGRDGLLIESLLPSPFNTVDFVTVPGADGRVLQIFEAAGRTTRERTLQEANATTATPPTIPNSQPGEDVNEQDAKKLQEAQTRADAAEAELARIQEAETTRLKEAAILTESKTYAADVLKNIELPELSRERLTESLAKTPVLTDGELDKDGFKTVIEEAAAAEIDYLKQVAGIGDGNPQNIGGAAPELKESGTPPAIANMRAVAGLT